MPTNITVDDEVGDPLSGLVPTYIPAGGWKQGNGCGTCHAKPDRRRAFNETWHDATHFVGDADPRIIHIHFDGEWDFTRSLEHCLQDRRLMPSKAQRYTRTSSSRTK